LYYWENAGEEEEGGAYKVTYDFTDPYPFMLVNIGESFLSKERKKERKKERRIVYFVNNFTPAGLQNKRWASMV
jgi:hypothetical protein